MKKKQLEDSFINGLDFCVRFFNDTKCFKYECVQYLMCLTSMVCINNKNKKVQKYVYSVFMDVLNRVYSEIDKLVLEDYDYFVLMYACSLIKNRTVKMKIFNKINKRYSRTKCPNKSLQYLKENNYDDLVDDIIDHMYIKLCRKGFPNIKFPKDHYRDYKYAIERIDYDKAKPDSDLDYNMTHIIYAYNYYGCVPLKKTKFIKKVEQYLINRTESIYKYNDIDLMAETLECFIILKNKKWLNKHKQQFLTKILSKQRKSGKYKGAWISSDDITCYDRFHGTWTCINLLSTILHTR